MEAIMALTSGKYFPEAALGKVFIGSTVAAGTAFPISTGTAATFGLWNTNPDKWAVLQRLTVGFTSGTIALGTIGLANVNGGFSTATGNNISAFTDGVLGTTIRNAIIGQGNAPSMRFTPSAATVVANTACYWTGMSIESASAGTGIFTASHDFDGGLIVPPGQFVFVAGSVAQTGLFTMSLTWAEIDIP
jgi:hypothetical protein